MKNVFLVACLLCIMQQLSAQTWTSMGTTNYPASPYNLYYYKLAQVNSDAHRYASIFEVSVQADANYFHEQATYQVRIDKYEGTTGRFDGMEIIPLSGNPEAATFYIFNNALWVQSKYQWGNVYYRTVADFTGNTPLVGAPFGQTITGPTGYLQSISGYGAKCNFDNNQINRLPYVATATGAAIFDGRVGIGTNAPVGKLNLDFGATRDNITITSDGNTIAYSDLVFQVKTASAIPTSNASSWVISHRKDGLFSGSPYSSLEFYGPLQGGGYVAPLSFKSNGDVVIASPSNATVMRSGNVGIGTVNAIEKLSVNGTVLAKKVRVSQAAADWPDYVFDPAYQLPSLENVLHFIKENKHLPELPSASAIEKDGHDLGAMQTLLLKKIEELTLYVINQKAAIDNMKKDNAELKEENMQIKAELKQVRAAKN